MSIVWFIKNLLGALLLPPGNGLLLLGIAGVFRKRRWALGLSMFAGAILFAQSLPVVSQWLITTLEKDAGPVVTEAKGAGAIVVLSSGLNFDAPEYGGDTANERTLVRLRYGAHLAHKLGLPVLVSGGKPLRASKSEAAVMAEIMEHEMGVKVRWREVNSMDTAENARLSAEILGAAGIKRIVLVTQAFHMPRARLLFEQAGLEVVKGPTGFKGHRGAPPSSCDWIPSSCDWIPSPFDWIPTASAIQNTYYALHEWLGIAWLKLSNGAGR